MKFTRIINVFMVIFMTKGLLAMDPQTPKNNEAAQRALEKEKFEYFLKWMKFEIFNYPVIFLDEDLEASRSDGDCIAVPEALLYKNAKENNWLSAYIFIKYYYQNQNKLGRELRKSNSPIITTLKGYKAKINNHIKTCNSAIKDEEVGHCCLSHSFDRAIEKKNINELKNIFNEIIKTISLQVLHAINREFIQNLCQTQTHTAGYSGSIKDLINHDIIMITKAPGKAPPLGDIAGKYNFESVYHLQFNYIKCLDELCLENNHRNDFIEKDYIEVSYPTNLEIYLEHFLNPHYQKNILENLIRSLFEKKPMEGKNIGYSDKFNQHFKKYYLSLSKGVGKISLEAEKIEYLKEQKSTFDLYLKYLFSHASVNIITWLNQAGNKEIYDFLFPKAGQKQEKKAAKKRKDCVIQ